MINSTRLICLAFGRRLAEIDRFRLRGIETQNIQLQNLIGNGSQCQYLKAFGVNSNDGYERFTRLVPVSDYGDIMPEIMRIRSGNVIDNPLWSSPVRWFAKSSGTTASQSKFIPITTESLHNCHFQGARDTMAIYSDTHPNSKAFNGKALTLGGSVKIDSKAGIPTGDLSAILISQGPTWINAIRFPAAEVVLISDFEKKLDAICRCAIGRNVTSFAGVPSWNLVLMNRILDFTGKDNIHQVWPNMSLFIHGGISFGPYREQFKRIMPDNIMTYMETYNASEGFFAIQDDPQDSSMLLMLDYGVFYEFLELSSLGDNSKIVPLEGVKTGVNYAMIITTNGGLWRYMIGDTVEFTSLCPYKIKITGRTKQYINAFGEELIVDNAENALMKSCKECGAIISEYTAGPIFMDGRTKGAHQWIIEFSRFPNCSIEEFTIKLDKALQLQNTDYQAKRFKNATLLPPTITVVPSLTFLKWMTERGKLGGQNKVPRLANHREFLNGILEMVNREDSKKTISTN